MCRVALKGWGITQSKESLVSLVWINNTRLHYCNKLRVQAYTQQSGRPGYSTVNIYQMDQYLIKIVERKSEYWVGLPKSLNLIKKTRMTQYMTRAIMHTPMYLYNLRLSEFYFHPSNQSNKLGLFSFTHWKIEETIGLHNTFVWPNKLLTYFKRKLVWLAELWWITNV